MNLSRVVGLGFISVAVNLTLQAGEHGSAIIGPVPPGEPDL
jgi:hypothetical protein